MSLSLFGERKATVKPGLKRRGTEAIEMRARRFGYFPRTFVWQGREFQVEAVERCWTAASRRNSGKWIGTTFKCAAPRARSTCIRT